LVRRNVCRLTSKNYNNLFVQVISKLIESHSVTEQSLGVVLKAFTEDTNRFPPDSEFKAAFSNEVISNTNAKEILYCISLYQIHNPKQDVKKLSSSSYSVEHMMPQKWETNWSTNGMNDVAKTLRNKKLKTLGNLTLVTKSLNSSMKNAAWEKKREVLKKYSLLRITTDYTNNLEWDESKIDSRAGEFADMAVKMWPY